MATSVNLEQVAALAAQLPPAERLRLVEKIAHDLAGGSAGDEQAKRPTWKSLRGIAPDLLGGEDAQAWVSRTRREADEHREKQLRREP
jgi:hypothetical protein